MHRELRCRNALGLANAEELAEVRAIRCRQVVLRSRAIRRAGSRSASAVSTSSFWSEAPTNVRVTARRAHVAGEATRSNRKELSGRRSVSKSSVLRRQKKRRLGEQLGFVIEAIEQSGQTAADGLITLILNDARAAHGPKEDPSSATRPAWTHGLQPEREGGVRSVWLGAVENTSSGHTSKVNARLSRDAPCLSIDRTKESKYRV